MKVSIQYFIREFLRYPSDKTVRYFCKKDMKFYYNVEVTKEPPKNGKVKYVIPLIRINIIELMEQYLEFLNISKEEVIRSAMEEEPNNSTWKEDDESIFDVAFRIYADGRYIEKDGREIDMLDYWFDYHRAICLPIAKEFCKENGIKWYDSEFAHFLHRWRHTLVFEPNPKDIFVEVQSKQEMI